MESTGLTAFVTKHFPWPMQPAIVLAAVFAASTYLVTQGIIEEPAIDFDAPLTQFVADNWWVFSGGIALWGAILGSILTGAIGWMKHMKLRTWPSFLVIGALLILSFTGPYTVYGAVFALLSAVWGFGVLPRTRRDQGRNLSPTT